MNAANDNRLPILTSPVTLAGLACYAGRRFAVEIPGCPVQVTKLTTRTGITHGFELSFGGTVVGLLGAKATFNHLEAACRRIAGGLSWK